MMVFISMLTLYYEHCIFLATHAKCYKRNLDKLEEQIKSIEIQKVEENKKNKLGNVNVQREKKSDEMLVEFKANLCSINRFHSDSIQLSHLQFALSNDLILIIILLFHYSYFLLRY